MNMPTCPNPMFLYWLTEWRKEAESKGTKAHFTYVKAIRSLMKYPLLLPTGKHCKILENFGDKICGMLDAKLSQYEADHPHEPITSSPDRLSLTVSPDRLSLPGCKKTTPTKRKAKVVPKSSPPAASSSKGGRFYVPVVKSGAYALLLALYNNKRNPGSVGSMSKVELMKEAQPLSEKSFKHPDPGSRYTAWSSMGTLIKKDLVGKRSSPARYSITGDGCVLAERLIQANGATSCSVDADGSCVSPKSRFGGLNNAVPDVEMIDIPIKERLNIASNGYVTSPNKRQRKTKAPAEKRTRKTNADKPASAKPAAVLIDTTLGPSHSLSMAERHKDTIHTGATGLDVGKTRNDTTIHRQLDLPARRPAPPTVPAAQINADKMADQTLSLWQLAPYSYDIILCVDNAELHGSGSGAGRECLLAELKNNKIAFDVRKLQVGDFLWVARDRTGRSGNIELVLDYIVERKRMDDLAGSIIDGRFSEQKYRLIGSKITNVIYLIESYGSAQHFSIPEDSLMQAITNTQVVDGFFVKETGNVKESAAYLTLLTRYLQSYYAGKALLHAETERTVKLARPSRQPLLRTFEEFSEASIKTKASTVCEMMCRQLLQLHGMTAEKVTAITDIYSTPASLYAAYQSCVDEKQKEELLTHVKAGALQRSIGKNLGKGVSLLYCTKAPAL